VNWGFTEAELGKWTSIPQATSQNRSSLERLNKNPGVDSAMRRGREREDVHESAGERTVWRSENDKARTKDRT